MLESGDTLGRYRIVDLIGSGGMGEVYLAEDTELQRRVAVKLFTRELDEGGARDHLLHEARAASALSHPNVCTVFEVGEDDGLFARDKQGNPLAYDQISNKLKNAELPDITPALNGEFKLPGGRKAVRYCSPGIPPARRRF